MPQVIRVQNPNALAIPQVAALLRRATESVHFCAPGGFDSVAQEIYEHVVNPTMFMLLGMEKGEPRGVLLGFLPTSQLFPYPVVTLIYNEGSAALKRELGREVTRLLIEAGYSKAWAINGTGRSDEVWTRALIPPGIETTRIGSVMELAVE